MNFEQFLEMLPGPKRRRGDTAMARCPSHDDRDPSLSIALKEGLILLKCHAGCTTAQVLNALGITFSDLRVGATKPAKPSGNGQMNSRRPAKEESPSLRVTFRDIDLMQSALFSSPEGKTFLTLRGIDFQVAKRLKWGLQPLHRFDSETVCTALTIPHIVNGRILGLQYRTLNPPGTDKKIKQSPGSKITGLYAVDHLDRTLSDIVVVEGPMDCALLMSYQPTLHCVAVISATSQISPLDVAALRAFRRIFLLGDQDEDGQLAMEKLQAQLPSTKVRRPKLYGYKDIGDLYKADPEHFRPAITKTLVVARASSKHFVFEDLLTESEISSMNANAAKFVVDGIIPANDVTMFFGEEKSGKSMLAYYFGKCVSNGEKVFGTFDTIKRPVIYLDMENSANDQLNFIELFKHVGTEQVRYLTRVTGPVTLDLPALLECCSKCNPLLIVDSLTKFIEDADSRHSHDMSPIMDKLLNLCVNGATAILVHHESRGKRQYHGSVAIGANVARAYNVISKDRPQLKRLSMIATLSRGYDPVSVELEAFPAVGEGSGFRLLRHGMPNAKDGEKLIQQLVEQVREHPGGRCKRQDVKLKMRNADLVVLINLAVDRGLLNESIEGSSKILSIPPGTI